MNTTNIDEQTLRTLCHTAASIVVDALMMAGILQENDAEQAVGIVEEELLVRKAIGKL
jgi:hypothetical protein